MSNKREAPIFARFPVSWQDPEDANLYWSLDRMHWPLPITPMTGQYIDYMFLDGFNRACETYELPIRIHSRRINCYHYDSVVLMTLPTAEASARGQRAQKNLRAAMEQLAEQWQYFYLPEVKKHLIFWEGFDLGAATLSALLTHVGETVIRVKRVYEIHFLLYFPFVLAPSLFEELYSEHFGDEQTLEAYQLLQGIDNKSLEADRELWKLSRQAQKVPSVCAALQKLSAELFIPALEKDDAAREFLTALRAYLAKYGQRSDRSNEVDAVHWVEDPRPVIERLQAYIRRPARDPAAELAVQLAKRERAVVAARERLQKYPQPVMDQFEALLKAAQEGIFIGEEHSFWIDQQVTYRVRQVMLELGRRFVNGGMLDQIQDIFFLTFDEARATAERFPHQDRRRLVAGRQAEMAYFRNVVPPPTIGDRPGDPPSDDPLSRAISRFFGWEVSKSTETPVVIKGLSGSPGMARGPAKVIRSLAEAGKLQKGDVLVASTTQPAWTMLFADAAAVVTDTGGVLSHCAVVAREYRIPAVVGTGNATTVLQDGQVIEVDGDVGTVRVNKRSSTPDPVHPTKRPPDITSAISSL